MLVNPQSASLTAPGGIRAALAFRSATPLLRSTPSLHRGGFCRLVIFCATKKG